MNAFVFLQKDVVKLKAKCSVFGRSRFHGQDLLRDLLILNWPKIFRQS